MNETNAYMSEEEAGVFVSALIHIAGIDGMKDSEQHLINRFIHDLGYQEKSDAMQEVPFALEDAVTVLQTAHARSFLSQACTLMVKQDHEVSEEEREALEFMRRALVPEQDLDALLNHVQAADLKE